MKFKEYKLALTLGESNEFFPKISRNYPQVEGYLNFQTVASLLAFPLSRLKQEIESNQPITLIGNATASTHAFITWSLCNNPFPVYWVRTSLLHHLMAREPSTEDLSIKRKIKNGVILFPDNLIQAPGRSYLQWLAFLHQQPGELTRIQMKNYRIRDRDESETLSEELAWITMLNTGLGYSGLIDLTNSRKLNQIQYSDSALKTYNEKKFIAIANKVLVQLLKYFNKSDALDNNCVLKSSVLDPLWLDNQ